MNPSLSTKRLLLVACLSLTWVAMLLIPPGYSQEIVDNDEASKKDDIKILDTSAGKVLGLKKSTPWGKVITFYGIPYAEPVKRFQQSVPLLIPSNDGNDKVVTDPKPPAACMQGVHLREGTHSSIPTGGTKVSEDCLKVNVYQPANLPSGERLAVLLWVPGGGYHYSDMIQFDGSAMAAKGNIIVVTMNYRLGTFYEFKLFVKLSIGKYTSSCSYCCIQKDLTLNQQSYLNLD
jgi:hypothetical protein